LESDLEKGVSVTQMPDIYWDKYSILSLFKESTIRQKNLVPEIYLTKSLIYSLDKSEECLSKLSPNNLVKKSLLDIYLKTEFKITAELGSDASNILNTVKLKDPFVKIKRFEPVEFKCNSQPY
jgi:hypothetical protein